MGLRKVWNHWLVKMTLFAPYYLENLQSPYEILPEEWTANDLVAPGRTGIFLLTEICKKIPFTANQIRYQAKQIQNSREEMGVWKDEGQKLFLVNLAIFGPWLKSIWDKWSTDDLEG